MLNVSFKAWGEILGSMKGRRIPVVWCGAPHLLSGKKQREMTCIDMGEFHDYNGAMTAYENVLKGRKQERRGVGWLSYGVIEDEELAKTLKGINGLLRKLGEPEVAMDSE